MSRKRRDIPSAAELRELLPHFTAERAHAARASMLRSETRTDVLIFWWVRHGRAGVRELVRNVRVPELPRPPLIVVTFHVGPLLALGAALESSLGSVFAPVEQRRDGDTEAHRERLRLQTFYDAAQVLRGGGCVVMALDPQDAVWIRVPFFGRTASLARGAFALSRMTGAPIVPVVTRWRGSRVELVSGDPLDAPDGPDGEHAHAAAVARWLEDYLRTNPEEISLRILEWIRS